MLVKVVGSRQSLTKELACAVAEQFMDGSGEKSHNMRGVFEERELGGENPVAGEVGIVVDAETVREDNFFEAVGLSDVIVLLKLAY